MLDRPSSFDCAYSLLKHANATFLRTVNDSISHSNSGRKHSHVNLVLRATGMALAYVHICAQASNEFESRANMVDVNDANLRRTPVEHIRCTSSGIVVLCLHAQNRVGGTERKSG